MTQRPVNQIWTEDGEGFSPAQHSYVNERNTAWTYDADGNLTDSNSVDYTIDATGQTQRFVSITPIEPPPGQPILDEYAVTLDVTQSFDGNGMAVKKTAANTVHGSQGGDQTTSHTTYLLRSSALGGKVVSEIGSESEQRGFVYLGGSVLAVQNRPTQSVMWEYRDPGNASVRMTTSSGTLGSEGNAELDPLGSDAGLAAPPAPSPAQYWKITVFPGFGNSNNNLTCVMDGMLTPCSEVGRAANNGSAVVCPENDCRPRHDGGGWRFWNPGTGWSRSWVDDDGQPLPNGPATPEVDPDDRGATLTINTNDNSLGHWDLFNFELAHWFFSPQNQLPTHQQVPNLKPSPEQQRCSDYLARLFGGKGAEAGANGFTPSGAYRGAYTYNGKRLSGHLSDYAIHVSGSKDQTQDTDIFVPSGGQHTLSTSDPDGNTVDLFYYKNLSGLGSYTLAVLHLDRSSHKPAGSRLHIGRTGGPGGDGLTDRHVHIELLKGRWNTFPKPSIRGSSRTNLSVLCPRE